MTARLALRSQRGPDSLVVSHWPSPPRVRRTRQTHAPPKVTARRAPSVRRGVGAAARVELRHQPLRRTRRTRLHVMLGSLTISPRNADASLTTSRVQSAILNCIWGRSCGKSAATRFRRVSERKRVSRRCLSEGFAARGAVWLPAPRDGEDGLLVRTGLTIRSKLCRLFQRRKW